MTTKKTESVFETLSAIDTANKIGLKGKFSYISWSTAVRELLKAYPTATWEFTQFEGLPYLETKIGYFVECAVTINDITRKQMMPILDFKNQPVLKADASQVNKTQMRALAKAIALHGFGLDLWAGEDLDGIEEEKAEAKKTALETPYPDEYFENNLSSWNDAIQAGKMTKENCIGKILTIGTLTDDQKSQIIETPKTEKDAK